MAYQHYHPDYFLRWPGPRGLPMENGGRERETAVFGKRVLRFCFAVAHRPEVGSDTVVAVFGEMG